MGKIRKILIGTVIGVFILIIVFISYCVYSINSYREYNPYVQKNTEWISEDKRIRFAVPQSGSGKGTLITDTGEEIDITVVFYIGDKNMEVWSDQKNGEITENSLLEKWSGTHYSKNEFIVSVKESTYYDINQTIKFKKSSIER